MKISEIYEFEGNREFPRDKYRIRFIHEGNWWRAYEWSAYLAHNFPNNLPEKDRLSLSKKHYVDLGKDLVVVGLQLKSFEKYLPNVKFDNNLFSIEDSYFDIYADKFYNKNEISFDDFDTFFENWKNEIKLSDKKSKRSENNNLNNNENLLEIAKEISDYQISNKTLIENTVFLDNIQAKIKKIIK